MKKTLLIQKNVLPLQSEKKQVGAIAQLVEQRTENPCVPSSILGGATKKIVKCGNLFLVPRFQNFKTEHKL